MAIKRTKKRSFKKVKSRYSKQRKIKTRDYVICKCGRKVKCMVNTRKRKNPKRGGYIRGGTMQQFVTCGGKVVNG